MLFSTTAAAVTAATIAAGGVATAGATAAAAAAAASTAAFATGLGTLALAGGGAAIAMNANNQSANEAKRQGNYNSMVYDLQGKMIKDAAGIEAGQYDRAIARTNSKGIVRTAGAGLLMSGSPNAVMIDTETQMLMDKAIGQYNFDVQGNYVKSGAKSYKDTGIQSARLIQAQGYSNAYSTMLTAGYNAGLTSMPIKAGKL